MTDNQKFTFNAIIQQNNGMDAAFIEFPFDVHEKFGTRGQGSRTARRGFRAPGIKPAGQRILRKPVVLKYERVCRMDRVGKESRDPETKNGIAVTIKIILSREKAGSKGTLGIFMDSLPLNHDTGILFAIF